jgi:hypothetical protein
LSASIPCYRTEGSNLLPSATLHRTRAAQDQCRSNSPCSAPDDAKRCLGAGRTGLADPSQSCAKLWSRPAEISGATQRRVPQVAFCSLRTLALSSGRTEGTEIAKSRSPSRACQDCSACPGTMPRGPADRPIKRLTISTAEVCCAPHVLSRDAMSVVSFTRFSALFFVLSHSSPPFDSRRPKCWEINRNLYTFMYFDVQGFGESDQPVLGAIAGLAVRRVTRGFGKRRKLTCVRAHLVGTQRANPRVRWNEYAGGINNGRRSGMQAAGRRMQAAGR